MFVIGCCAIEWPVKVYSPPPSTVPLGETFWTIRISENTMGALTERRSRPAISLRIFWEMRHRKLLQSLNQCQWCGAPRSMHGLDGFRRLSIRVWPSGRGSVWINPAAVQSRTPNEKKKVLFLKGIHWFFKQIPTSNKLFSERLCTRKTYSIFLFLNANNGCIKEKLCYDKNYIMQYLDKKNNIICSQ